MLQKSLKWMILTLIAAGLLIGGIVWLVSALSAPALAPAEQSASPSDIPSASPSNAPTPEITFTAAPTATPTPEPTAAPTPEPRTEADWLREYINGMSIEEKLGQLAMFGGSGTSSPSSEFVEIMNTYQIGNVVLYGANVNKDNTDGGFSQAARLTAALRERCASELPMLISIDVEGGDVVRFHWSKWPSSARTLGRNNNRTAAHDQFLTIGEKLLKTGINVNLAPVLDVAPSPMDTFLTTRIISSDTAVASDIGTAIIEGLHDAGCLSAAKHFPGHGGTSTDSHTSTPVVNKTTDALYEYDLIPFAAAVDAGVDIMLVAHILYPGLDEDNIATLSPAIIDGLLRGELGFDGVVMSDDFRMGGLTSQCSVGEAAVRFLLAGGDLVLCGPQYNKQRDIMAALYQAAADGTLSEARINESVERILLKKMKVTGWSPVPDGASVSAEASG